MDNERSDGRGISEKVNSVDLGNHRSFENSSGSDDHNVCETVIVIRAEEEAGAVSVGGGNGNSNGNGTSNSTVSLLGSSKEPVGDGKIEDLKVEKESCVIDVNSGSGHGGGGGKLGENLDRERVCRICHLSSDPSLETEMETETVAATAPATTITMISSGLIQLGCGCKDELGIVHTNCAETWFKLRGNRKCEICGETAKNITGVGDIRFTDELNETRSAGSATNLSERGARCSQGQPFCNFLMACLVIAFVLPWFFRVNMF